MAEILPEEASGTLDGDGTDVDNAIGTAETAVYSFSRRDRGGWGKRLFLAFLFLFFICCVVTFALELYDKRDVLAHSLAQFLLEQGLPK